MSKTKKVLVIVGAVLAVLLIAGAVQALTSDNGNINQWTVKDKSGQASPVAETVQRGGDAGRVRNFSVENHSGDPVLQTATRGTAYPEYCRTARGYVEGGNASNGNLVHATVSQRFCYIPIRRKITSLGNLNLSPVVTAWGSFYLWHNSGSPYAVMGGGENCTGSPPYCWEYKYRRGVFQWERGVDPVSQQVNGCVSITMRGTGDVIVGEPNC